MEYILQIFCASSVSEDGSDLVPGVMDHCRFLVLGNSWSQWIKQEERRKHGKMTPANPSSKRRLQDMTTPRSGQVPVVSGGEDRAFCCVSDQHMGKEQSENNPSCLSHVLVDHSSPAREEGWEEAFEGSFLCLTTSLSGVMDIPFPTKLSGHPCFSVSFPKPAHQISVLSEAR